jgi:hypothetical protein
VVFEPSSSQRSNFSSPQIEPYSLVMLYCSCGEGLLGVLHKPKLTKGDHSSIAQSAIK